MRQEKQLSGRGRRKNMIAQVLVEGLILGILLMGICAFGIRNGAVGMVKEISGLVSGRCL